MPIRARTRSWSVQSSITQSSMADSDNFSVLVLASDLGVDGRSFLSRDDKERRSEIAEEQGDWHDCPSYFDEDFSDLELLRFIQVRGFDRHGNRILQIVGKYLPDISCSSPFVQLVAYLRVVLQDDRRGRATSLCCCSSLVFHINTFTQVISCERLKKYAFYKILSEVAEGPYCILYVHTTVQKEDNSPGITILRWIYEDLPAHVKERLQTVYFLHPGIRSRLAFATLGRFFLSGNLYWKIKYVSRLQYLWEDIKKGEAEIPEFVKKHDDILEHRPLTDYGIEPDPLPLGGVPSPSFVFGRHEDRWTSREYIS